MITKTGSLSLSNCMEPNMASYYLDEPSRNQYNYGLTLDNSPTKQEAIENFIANKIWITKESKRIRVENMTNTHIINTITAFKTKKIDSNYLGGKDRWLEIFEKELSKRGIKN